MVDASFALDAIVAVSIAAGAFFAIVELQDLKKDRRLGLVIEAGMRLTSREFEEAVCKLWRTDTTDAKELETKVSYVDLSMITDFYSGMANLGLVGMVDKEALTSFVQFSPVWNKVKPFVVAQRAATGLNLWADLEKMAQFEKEEGLFPAAKQG